MPHGGVGGPEEAAWNLMRWVIVLDVPGWEGIDRTCWVMEYFPPCHVLFGEVFLAQWLGGSGAVVAGQGGG